MRRRLPLGWADLLVAAFLVLMIGTPGISGIIAARETASRARCASNLHQIGLAILLYQNDNMQLYPRTVADNADDPTPVWGTPYQADPKLGPQDTVNSFGGGKFAPAPNDVTASLFLLMRNEQLTAAVFVCPSTTQQPWDFGRSAQLAQNWTNWQGNYGLARHLSYSMQNPFASKAAISGGFQLKNPDATFAVVADMNPGGEAVTAVTLESNMAQMQKANTLNHGGEGQNVLFGDGHAEWETTPFVGTSHDNIYTAGGPEIKADERTKAVIVASPVSATDSILLPTAADIGFKVKTFSGKPLTPAERDKLKSAIQGQFASAVSGAEARLTVDDKSIKCTSGDTAVEYGYEVIGGSDDTLVVKLTDTAKGTTQRGTIELDEDSLQIATAGHDDLDYPWHRVKNATP